MLSYLTIWKCQHINILSIVNLDIKLCLVIFTQSLTSLWLKCNFSYKSYIHVCVCVYVCVCSHVSVSFLQLEWLSAELSSCWILWDPSYVATLPRGLLSPYFYFAGASPMEFSIPFLGFWRDQVLSSISYFVSKWHYFLLACSSFPFISTFNAFCAFY